MEDQKLSPENLILKNKLNEFFEKTVELFNPEGLNSLSKVLLKRLIFSNDKELIEINAIIAEYLKNNENSFAKQLLTKELSDIYKTSKDKLKKLKINEDTFKFIPLRYELSIPNSLKGSKLLTEFLNDCDFVDFFNFISLEEKYIEIEKEKRILEDYQKDVKKYKGKEEIIEQYQKNIKEYEVDMKKYKSEEGYKQAQVNEFFNAKKQEFINAIKSQYKTETEITTNIDSFTDKELYDLKIAKDQRGKLIELNKTHAEDKTQQKQDVQESETRQKQKPQEKQDEKQEQAQVVQKETLQQEKGEDKPEETLQKENNNQKSQIKEEEVKELFEKACENFYSNNIDNILFKGKSEKEKDNFKNWFLNGGSIDSDLYLKALDGYRKGNLDEDLYTGALKHIYSTYSKSIIDGIMDLYLEEEPSDKIKDAKNVAIKSLCDWLNNNQNKKDFFKEKISEKPEDFLYIMYKVAENYNVTKQYEKSAKTLPEPNKIINNMYRQLLLSDLVAAVENKENKDDLFIKNASIYNEVSGISEEIWKKVESFQNDRSNIDEIKKLLKEINEKAIQSQLSEITDSQEVQQEKPEELKDKQPQKSSISMRDKIIYREPFDQKFDEIKNYIPFKDDEAKISFFKEELKKNPEKFDKLIEDKESYRKEAEIMGTDEEYLQSFVNQNIEELYKLFENLNKIKNYTPFKDNEIKMNFFKEELKKNLKKVDELVAYINEAELYQIDEESIGEFIQNMANELMVDKRFENYKTLVSKEIILSLSAEENFSDIEDLFKKYEDILNSNKESYAAVADDMSIGEEIKKIKKHLIENKQVIETIDNQIKYHKGNKSVTKPLEDAKKKKVEESQRLEKSWSDLANKRLEMNISRENLEEINRKEKELLFKNIKKTLKEKIGFEDKSEVEKYIDNVLLKGNNLNEIKENFNDFKKYLEGANNSLKVEFDSKILGLKDEKFKNFIEGSKEAKSVALDEYKKYLRYEPNQEEQPFKFTDLKKEYINFANIFSVNDFILNNKAIISLDKDISKKYDDVKNYIKIFKNNEAVVAEVNKLIDHGAKDIESELSEKDKESLRSIYDNKVKVALSRGNTLEEINKKTREEVLKEILGSTEDILKGEVFGSQIDSGDKGTIRGAIENKNFFKRPFDSFRTFKESIEGNLQNVNTEDFMKNFMKNFVESSERKISGKSRIKAFSGREEQRKFSVFFLKSMESTLNAIQNNMDFLDKKDRDFFSGYSLKINETIKKIESKYLNETAKKDFDEKAKIFETEVETKNNIRKIKATIKDKDSGFTNVENDKCIKLSHYDSKKGEVVDLEGEEINKFFEGHQELRERVEGLRQNLNEENIKAFEEEVKKTDLTKMEPCNFAFVYKKDGKQKIHIVNFGGKEDEKAQCSTKLKLVNGREIEVSLNEKNECIFKEGGELVSESTKNILNRVFDVEGVRLEQEKTLQQKLVLDKGKKDKSTQTIQL